MHMRCTGCGKVINNPEFLAKSIWSLIDAQTSAQGAEMSTKPRLSLYIMCVNIMLICFGLRFVSLMATVRATILEHMHMPCTVCANIFTYPTFLATSI